MLVTCPGCLGRLSTVAPQCPHCGFVPHFAAGGRAPGGARPAPLPFETQRATPSKESLQKATRRTLADWKQSVRKRFLVGALLLVGAVTILVGVFLLANRINAGRRTQGLSRTFVAFAKD